MAEFIVMPKLGFDMREGVLANWLKKVGDPVEKGEVIAEIESDKATLELEAQAGGTLLKILADEGDVVPIGGNIAVVGEEGEDVAGTNGDGAAEPAAASAQEGAEAPGAKLRQTTEEAPRPEKPRDRRPAPDGGRADRAERREPAAEVANRVDGAYPGGVKASPVARRIADEHGVDLTRVEGSGPEGRVRRADVEAYLERAEEAPRVEEAPAARKAAPAAEPVAVPAGAEVEEVPSSRLRQAIGRRMLESKTTVPHFYVTTDIDMAPVFALRKQINAMLSDEERVSLNDIIVKAAALALRDFPNLNASFGGDKLIRHKEINIGSAVAVEGGLLTVVQYNTDSSTLSKIAADNRERIARAREGKVRPEDIEGATFTVSNLGAYDVDHFIAIINPPNAAILAVGTAQEVPVVRDGQIVIGTRMKATISADHRITDGAEAARYMQRFKEILEEPMRLLI